MINMDTHALFSIDDSTNSVDDSINVLKNAYANGISTCVLTPSCILHRKGDTERFLEKRNQSTQLLKQLNLKDLPKVLFGAQVLMDHDLSLHKNIDKLCIDDGKYLLVELPNFDRIPDFDEWIYSLNIKGIIPIIAHVEKYPLWKNLIDGLSSVKVCYQVSADNLNSFFKRKIIKKLLQEQKKFFVSSDINSLTTKSVQLALKKAKRHFPKT